LPHGIDWVAASKLSKPLVDDGAVESCLTFKPHKDLAQGEGHSGALSGNQNFCSRPHLFSQPELLEKIWAKKSPSSFGEDSGPMTDFWERDEGRLPRWRSP
jgi:hypothetical protein